MNFEADAEAVPLAQPSHSEEQGSSIWYPRAQSIWIYFLLSANLLCCISLCNARAGVLLFVCNKIYVVELSRPPIFNIAWILDSANRAKYVVTQKSKYGDNLLVYYTI